MTLSRPIAASVLAGELIADLVSTYSPTLADQRERYFPAMSDENWLMVMEHLTAFADTLRPSDTRWADAVEALTIEPVVAATKGVV